MTVRKTEADLDAFSRSTLHRQIAEGGHAVLLSMRTACSKCSARTGVSTWAEIEAQLVSKAQPWQSPDRDWGTQTEMADPIRGTDLKEACVTEALAIIDKQGLEHLSLREVARRLGVSHQAPYKHFLSRDHILAEIVARAFEGFALHLDAHAKSDDPESDLGHMGQAYLAYARKHPLQYRLMFGTPLPDGEAHPEMMLQAKHAFELLCEGLSRKARAAGRLPIRETILLDALFIWAGLHGLASILGSSTTGTLQLPKSVLAKAPQHLLSRFGDALRGEG
jgi:AcrR family transcriptional regulator